MEMVFPLALKALEGQAMAGVTVAAEGVGMAVALERMLAVVVGPLTGAI